MLDPQAYQALYRAARSATLPTDSNAIADGVLGLPGLQAGGGGLPSAPYSGAPVQSLSPAQAASQWRAESGGHQLDPKTGKPLTSAKGAIGIAQVMPDTARMTADAHGIPWDPTKFATDAGYNAQLGTLYMNDLLQEFHGNYPAALAAYDAGPNDFRVQRFAETGDLSVLPAETQKYVREITGGGAGTAGGSPMSLQEIGANLPALMDKAGQQAMREHPDDADNAYQSASYAVYRKYQSMVVSNDAAQKANLSTVTNAVTQGKFTDPDQIVKAGGATAQAWVNLDPDARATVFTLMKHNLPGADVVWSPQAQSMSDQLVGLSITDPAAFRKVNLLDPHYLDVMPHDMISALSNRQTDAMATVVKGLSDDEVRSAVSFVSPLAISGGINPKAREGTSDYQTYQQFVGAFTADVSAYFDQHSRMPDAATQQQMARRLLIKGTVAGTGSMFFGPKSEYLFEAEGQGGNLPGFQATIPPDQLSAINTAYSKMYGHPPDMATATQLYLESQAPKSQ
jgi:soluble lytic murein transglycosylase-like protein